MARIWFIAEDDSGFQIARRILEKRGIRVQVERLLPTGSNPNIFQLAKQIDRLIATVRQDKRWSPQDCIAVLHDWDIHKQPDRTAYDTIRAACERHKQEGLPIKEVTAKDEVEGWLLADSGVCAWLAQKPDKKCDTRPKPKDMLDNWCKDARKPPYKSEKGLKEVVNHIAGDGDKYSPSLREALTHLEIAPCIQP